MRLAFLVESFDTHRGGAERAVLAVVQALAARGVEATVYAPADRPGPELAAPARRVAVPLPPLPHPLRALALARALPLAAARDGAGVRVATGKLLEAELWWPHGGLHRAARRASARAGRGPAGGAGARLLRRLRSVEWAYDRIEERQLRACARGASRFVALSERVRGDLAAWAPALAGSAAVVRNGVDRVRFQPPGGEERLEARRALAERVGAGRGATLALFCAHQFRLKGLDTALAALTSAPGAHLLVAGVGRPGRFLRLARRLGVAGRVTLLGRVADMPAVYRGADCLIHPSRYDPCSLVVLEALACGLPVLASAADGASELIPAGGGFSVPDPEDAGSFAAGLRALADPAQRQVMAEAAASFDRSWEQVAAELLALCEAAA